MRKRIIKAAAGIIALAGIVLGVLYIRDVVKIMYNIKYTYYGYSGYYKFDKLNACVDSIYQGTVEDITFDVYNDRTGEFYRGEPIEEQNREWLTLVTIYKVKVDVVYQGEWSDYYYVMSMGGIEGYHDLTQGIILKNAGATGRHLGGNVNWIGEKILFATKNREGLQILANPYSLALEVGGEQYERIAKNLNK